MEFFINFWKNIEGLKSLSSYLNWFSIILIILGGFLLAAKHIVDRREKTLSDNLQIQKDSLRTMKETELQTKIEDFETDIEEKQEEIEELKETAKFTDPYKQPIRSGSSTIEVTIESSEQINTTFMDRGGYIAFGSKGNAIMVMSSNTSTGITSGKNQVTYKGVFNLDASDVAIGKIVNSLKHTEFVQISFAKMPEQSIVLGGKAICTINGIVRFEMDIQPQKISKDFIIINKLKETFKSFK